jgi:hypothetical protein
MPNAFQDEIDRWLLLAKDEAWSVEVLFFKVEDYYIEGIGGIDHGESVYAGLAAVLSLSPGHQLAIQMKDEMEEALASVREEAENLFRLAESKFTSRNLTGCIDLLTLHTGRNIRYRQAQELLLRMKEKMLVKAEVDPNNDEAKLLLSEIENLEPDLSLSAFRLGRHKTRP